jgi:nucleoid DNA-binding protein
VVAAASHLATVVGEALSIRKKELVERVVAASGAKKKQVKEIVEHTLKVLGEALAKGEELNLPPFGKAKVNRSKGSDTGTTMMVKLKQGGDQAAARKAARKGAKEGLAKASD